MHFNPIIWSGQSQMATNYRVVEQDSASRTLTMAVMLYSIPNSAQKICETVAVFPGLGESWRVIDAIRIYKTNQPKMKNLLVAGHNPTEEFYEDFRDGKNLLVSPYDLSSTDGLVITSHATHTKEQCEWVCDTMRHHDLTSIVLTASPYHLLRAYLTLLKTFLNRGEKLPLIIPVPTIIAPATIIPETKVDAWTMVPGELARINTYQPKGDVATFEEFQKYLNEVVWEKLTNQSQK